VQVAISSYGDIALVLVGLIIQLFSILMDASRCCYLQRVLQMAEIKATPLVTLAHVAPFSAAALLLPTLFLEGPRLIESMPQWQNLLHWVLLSGVLASCLNLVIFKLIAMTSALTTSLSGVIKEWVCILVAMYVYDTEVTFLQWLGYGIAISGLVWYQVGKIYAQELVVSKGNSKLPVFEKPPQFALLKSSSPSSSGRQTPLLSGCESPCSDQEAGDLLMVAKQNSD
jgi:drug/metabolite transporter (DMT)-like permease